MDYDEHNGLNSEIKNNIDMKTVFDTDAAMIIHAEPCPPEKIKDFQIVDGVLEKYLGNDEIVFIPKGVKEIKEWAFSQNESIKKLIIPSEVKSIGNDAFYSCDSLSEVIIGEGVKDLHAGVFLRCDELRSLIIPESVEMIPPDFCNGCKKLEKIVLPSKTKEICGCAFDDCISLKEFRIPNMVESIGSHAFCRCTNLSTINIPSSVKDMALNAFRDCPDLEVNFDQDTRFEKCGDFPYTYKDKPFRKLLHRTKLSLIESTSLKRIAAIEFIRSSADYPDDLKTEYIEFCKKNRGRIINDAYTVYKDETVNNEIIRFYQEIGLSTKNKKLNEHEKVLLLEKMADEGTFEDFKTVFDKYKTFEFYPRALEKACASGDIEKVKLLVNANASFRCKYKNIYADRYFDDNYLYYNKQVYIENINNPPSDWYIDWNPYQSIVASQKTPPDEIVNVLLFLREKKLIEPAYVLAASLLSGKTEVTKVLIENGFNWQPPIFYKHFTEYINKFTVFPFDNREEILRIADDFKRYGYDFYEVKIPGQYYHSGSYFNYDHTAFLEPEILNNYLSRYYKEAPLSIYSLLFQCIDEKRYDTLSLLSERNYYVPYSDKYMDFGFFDDIFSLGKYSLESFKILIKKGKWPLSEIVYSKLLQKTKTYDSRERTKIANWLIEEKNEIVRKPKQAITVNPKGWRARKIEDGIYEISGYTGRNLDIIIPSMLGDKLIIKLNKDVFQNNNEIRSVVIGDGINCISESSFINCKNLESVQIPESVIRIESSAFRGCEKLQKITIPSSVRIIGADAFNGCTELHEIIFLSDDLVIGDYAFCNCKNLQKINIPSGVSCIGKGAFMGCNDLSNVTFNEGLKVIRKLAFKGCGKVENIKLPKSLEMIDEMAFSSAPIQRNRNNHNIVDDAHQEKLSIIKKKLSEEKYSQKDPIDEGNGELVFKFESKGTLYDGRDANIKNMVVGDPIEVVRDPENQFNSNNFRLFNEYGEDVGNMPGKLCNALAPFYDNNELIITEAIADHISPLGTILRVELHCEPNIRATDISKSSKENENVIKVSADDLFENKTSSLEEDSRSKEVICPSVDPFTYGDSQKEIIISYNGKGKELRIPDGVIKIGSAVFQNKYELESIILPDGLTEIRAYAFENCENLKSITIPDSLSIIGASAFKNCYELKHIHIPKGIRNVSKDAFEGCSELLINGDKFLIINDVLIAYTGNDSNVEIPKGIMAIEDGAFNNRKNLFNISIPDSIIYIGRRAFSDCENLDNVIIPDSVKIIDKEAFQNCRKLSNICISPNVTEFGQNIFEGCLRSKLKLSVYEGAAAMEYAEKNYLKYKKIKTKEKLQPLAPDVKRKNNILSKLIEIKNNLWDWSFNPHYDVYFDFKHEEMVLPFEAKGTMYEGRTENIEFVKVSDTILVERDPKNKFNPQNFRLFTEQGKDVGNVPEDICSYLASPYDRGEIKIYAKASYVEPLSKRGPRCRKGILFVELRCGVLSDEKQDILESHENVYSYYESKSVENGEESLHNSDNDVQQKDIKIASSNPVTSEYKYIIPAPRIGSIETESQFIDHNITIKENELLQPVGINEKSTEPIEPEQVIVFEKREITDPILESKIDQVFEKLEQYYPEHKVFALDNIDQVLRARISDLYKKAGYQSDNEMLRAYGFEFISGETIRKVRPYVLYTPGNEPDLIKPKVESMLRRLQEYYPDGEITGSLVRDHKKLSGSISGLYQWLGYPDATSMLQAYGYNNHSRPSGKQITNDYENIIQSLVEKYKTGPKPKNIAEVIRDNPEYKAPLKTLQNNQEKILGKSLKDYFVEVGILSDGGEKAKTTDILSEKTKEIGKTPEKTEKKMSSLLLGSVLESMNNLQQDQEHEDSMVESNEFEISDSTIARHDEQTDSIQSADNNTATEELTKQSAEFETDDSLSEIEPESVSTLTTEGLNDNIQYSAPDIVITEGDLSSVDNKSFTGQEYEQNSASQNAVIEDNVSETEEKTYNSNFRENSAEEDLETPSVKDFEEVSADADVMQFEEDEAPVQKTPEESPSPADQKSAWIQYQAYEVVNSGRASAYYFFDLRNEMALGNYNWQSDEFLYFYMKYFPGMTIDRLRMLRTQAIPWLTEPNACNTQYQIIMQDSFEHRYIMIAYAWFERSAVANFDSITRVQSVFNACRTFFYPQEQQEVWNRLSYESNS